jgi:predicted solute-binding protein
MIRVEDARTKWLMDNGSWLMANSSHRNSSGRGEEPSRIRLRIAGISYLNSAPYFSPFRLGAIEAPFDLELMTPAECNRAIAEGRADGGLVSSIAWARLGGETGALIRLKGLEIASDGEVGSITVYAGRGWDALRSVAVTSESATSVEMLRVLLAEERREVELVVSAAPLEAAMSGGCDGALLIGDAAMRPAPSGWFRWDLGALWRERTGTPMVYAVFALSPVPKEDVETIESALKAALAWSREHLDAVIDEWYTRASEAALPARLDRAAARSYLERLDAVRACRNLDEGLDEFLTRWRRVQAGTKGKHDILG